MANKRTTGITIGQVLVAELFNEDNIVNCGPRDTAQGIPPNFYEQNFNKIDRGVDTHLKKNHNYIPHETYHPQIAAGLDFTDSFTASLQKEVAKDYNIKASRLIDKNILMDRAKEILRFVKYYFEYTGSFKTYDTDTKRIVYEDIGQFYIDPDEAVTETDVNRLLNLVFNMFMTSIIITRSRGDIGSATITFKNVRNYTNGKSIGPLYSYAVGMLRDLLVPMLPVKLWARGRLYNQWFFPIFDGHIVSTSVKDSAGFAEIEITCKDVLEIARFTTEMVNPALVNIAEARKVYAINLQRMPFYGHDHMDMVKALFMGDNLEFDPTGEKTNFLNKVDSFGNEKDGFKFIKGIGFVPVDQAGNFSKSQHERLLTGRIFLNKKINLDKIRKESAAAAKKSGITPTLDLGQLEEFDWYTNLDSTLATELDEKMEEGPVREEEFTIDRILKEVSHAETRRKLITWGTRMTPYRLWEIQSPDTFSATFSSRLEVLQEISKNVYYDLYVDGSGSVNYHPYRFSNDYLFNDAIYIRPGENELYYHPTVWPGVYTIGPEESIDHNEMINFEELYTFMKLQGQDPFGAVGSDLGGIVGKAIHKDYLERFGYRRILEVNPLFNFNFSLDASVDSASAAAVTFMDIVAAALLIYRNGHLHTKTSTIIFRPELDVARPIYYTEDDMVFYIDSISHSITIGGDATTTVTSSFGRKIYDTPLDLQSFLQIQEGIWKYGEQVIDAQSFIKQLPIADWNNFLDKHQLEGIELTRQEIKLGPPPDYVSPSEDSTDILDIDTDDPDTDFISDDADALKAKTYKGYK
jgi:hypothetical protein